MAMMSLKVNRGPSLNLSGIFKAAMPDPDLAIKAALANSTIWGQEHQNQLYDQQREYARQQAAQEAQKTRDLEVLAGVRKAAVPGIERGLVGALPMPIPVDTTPRPAQQIIGPGEPHIVEADQRFYDDQVAGARARASLYPYIAKDATDLSSGYFKDVGGETLAAGLTPGGPAAVNLTPDKLRLAATLTGQMPTMSTALTKDDTVGADMATRQAVQTAAGKLPSDIALEQAKAEAVAKAGAAANPLGNDAIGRARQAVAEGDAIVAQGGKLNAEQQAFYNAAKQAINAADITMVPKGNTPIIATPTGAAPVTGLPEPAPGDTGMYADPSATDARQLGGITALATKMRDPKYKPSGQEATDYESGYTERYLQGKETIEPSKIRIPEMGIEIGDPVRTMTKPVIPKGIPTPEQVYARAGISPPGPAATAAPAVTPAVAPAATPAATPAPAPAVAGQAKTANGKPVDVGPVATLVGPNGGVSIQKIANGSGAPATEAEGKLRGYAGRAIFGSAYLDKLTGADVPDFLSQWFNNPSNGDLTSQYVQSIADPSTRQYMIFATAYLTAMLRKDSGAAITPDEFNLYKAFIPRPGDDEATLASRREARHDFIRSSLRDGYTTDTRGREIAEEEARLYKVDLKADPTAIPLTPTEQKAGAAGGGPNKLKLAPGVLVPPNWSHYPPEAAQRYIKNHPPPAGTP